MAGPTSPPQPPPVQSAPPGRRDPLLAVVVGIAIISALYVARDVLIPMTLAVLLAFVLSPIVGLLCRFRMPRVVAVVLAVVFAIGVIISAASAIGVQVASLAADLPRYESTIETKIGTVQDLLQGRISAALEHLGQYVPRKIDAGKLDAGAVPSLPAGTPIPIEVHQPGLAPLQIAQHMIPVLNRLETLAIVLVVTIFVLLQAEDLRNRFTCLAGSRDPERTALAISDAAHRLSRFFLAQLAINISVGLVIGMGLFLIGVPSPGLWGMLATLLRFVPYVGPALAAFLPTALAAAVSPGWGMALQSGLLFAVVEPVVGQFIEPMIYGHSTGISPVGVIVAALLWTWLWGSIGLIMSTPLTLCVLVLSRHVPQLAFLDILLGDRTEAPWTDRGKQPAK